MTSYPERSPSQTLHQHVEAMALTSPDKPVVFAGDSIWTWRDLVERVRAACDALRAAGLRGGERLVVVSENSPSTLVLMLAAQSLRAWPAVINARLPEFEVLKLVECADPRLVFFALDHSDATRQHAQQLDAEPFVVPGVAALAVLPRSPVIEAQPADLHPGDEVASMIFTSGTTGRPKAVMISHTGMLNHGLVCGASRGTKSDDIIEIVAPLSHVMGHTGVLSALLYGAAVRIQPRMAASELLGAIARGEVSQASMVPVAWIRLLEQIEKDRIDISGHRLHALVSGGAPLDPELKARIETAFGRDVQNAYGMTEVAPLARTAAGCSPQPWSVGRPETNVEVRIVDDHGRLVEAGQVGEIQARGPSVMKGYFGNPQATAEVMREGGWYVTGDLGRWLPDGDLAVVGRRKEMIIRSGFNVYPAEVEAALDSHPGVLLSAVVGEAAALGDEVVTAYVQLRESAVGGEPMRAELTAHVRKRLAPYKCPSVIEFVSSMPMGSTGKILKRELRRGA